MSTPPREVVRSLTDCRFRHLYLDGGKTIQGSLSEDPIPRLIFTKVPVLIGAGIPLFRQPPHDFRLCYLETPQFENGLDQSKYDVRVNLA